MDCGREEKPWCCVFHLVSVTVCRFLSRISLPPTNPQAIGAYNVEVEVDATPKTICFFDTPGRGGGGGPLRVQSAALGVGSNCASRDLLARAKKVLNTLPPCFLASLELHK